MGSFRAPSRSTQAVEQQRLAGDLPARRCQVVPGTDKWIWHRQVDWIWVGLESERGAQPPNTLPNTRHRVDYVNPASISR